MWTAEQQQTFEQTGILRLPNAFRADIAATMVDTIWRFVERKSGMRRDVPSTWMSPPISFKTLKCNPIFGALVGNSSVRGALDGIFGEEGWQQPKPGAQILMTMPSAPPWKLPHHLWHMDSGFERAPWPTFAVKLFACIATLKPGGGATLALGGSHRLVERFAAELAPGELGGNQVTWGRFMKQDPWLDELHRPGPEPGRTRRLLGGAHVVDGIPLQIVELCGEPGDVFVTHLQVFHCGSPNVNTTPRLMLGKGILARAAEIDAARPVTGL